MSVVALQSVRSNHPINELFMTAARRTAHSVAPNHRPANPCCHRRSRESATVRRRKARPCVCQHCIRRDSSTAMHRSSNCGWQRSLDGDHLKYLPRARHKHSVVISGTPILRRLPYVLDSRIRYGPGHDTVRGPICRSIVRNNELQIRESLSPKRLAASFKKPLRINTGTPTLTIGRLGPVIRL